MIIARLQETFVRVYLRSYPSDLRLERYAALHSWEWLRSALVKVEPELFPELAAAAQEEIGFIEPIGEFPDAAGLRYYQSLYAQYPCTQGNPLRCVADSQAQSIESAEATARLQCSDCGFPASLSEGLKIKDHNSVYVIEQQLGQRGLGRLYSGTQTDTKQKIVLKEYLLPSHYFNLEERRTRQEALKSLAGLSLMSNPGQNFRILSPFSVLVQDERCYLFFGQTAAHPTLKRMLQGLGPLPAYTVKRLLNQILQILEVLHEQTFQLPMGKTQPGLAHGNLNLETILIDLDQSSSMAEPSMFGVSDFFLYLSDLALWEGQFKPPLMKCIEPSVVQDLKDVGYIGFYALSGGAIAPDGHALDPASSQNWSQQNVALKEFIYRLLGLGLPFDNAAAARQALLKIPIDHSIQRGSELAGDIDTTPPPTKPQINWLALTTIASASLILGALALRTIKRRAPISTVSKSPALERIQDVGSIPTGDFTYTAVQDGTWNYLLKTADLIESGKTLEDKIHTAQPKLQLKFTASSSQQVALESVRSGQSSFAIVPLNQPLSEDFEYQPIAYDGLVAFVAFSYSHREQGLPTPLKGKISLPQLQQLYTGQANNWQSITASTLPAKSYQLPDSELSALFEQRIFAGESSAHSTLEAVEKPSNFFELLRSVLRDFESKQTGSIGFAPLSRVFGQCSVYPLAIQTKGESPVQPLVLKDGKAIDPETNLCDRKGSYQIDALAIRSGRYPLAYPIVVVYPRRNDRPIVGIKFAEMMRTKEGQRLLKQTGLTPAIEN
jgi:hypothetical protein